MRFACGSLFSSFLLLASACTAVIDGDPTNEQASLTGPNVLPMSQGAHGPNVELLQQLLTDAGFATPVTAEFDAKTFQEVRYFQQKVGLPMEGVVDQATATALDFVPIVSAPPAEAMPTWTPPAPLVADTWDDYIAIVAGADGDVPSGTERTVLGIRTQTTHSHDYLDVFVVLSADGVVTMFHGTTVPSYMGKNMGELVPSSYDVVPHGLFHLDDEQQEAKPSFEIRSRNGGLPTCWRDADGDGAYSDAEQVQTSPMTGELFHEGWIDDFTQNPHHPAPASEGCMNLPVDEMDAFVTAVGGANAKFHFTLVNK